MARLLLIAFKQAEAAMGAGFASQLGIPFDVLCFGGPAETDLGAEKVFAVVDGTNSPADGTAGFLADFISAYSHIAAVSTMRSKDVLARLAGLCDFGMVTDVVSIDTPTVFKRPVVAGSIIATVEVLTTPVVITFRPSGFSSPAQAGSSVVENVHPDIVSMTKVVGTATHGGSRPDLSQAKVIVSGGRPLRDAATFELVIGGLADALGGAVGATRAAVDSGIATNEMQVGQTGKIVAPDLYIAAGISGSTQHMAGIKDSKIIVAINKDPDAPIFEAADYGLVADLYEAIPELRKELGR